MDLTHDGEADAYTLGTESREIERLRLQHDAWAGHTRAFWEAGGLRAGLTVLDAGCGPGFTSLELARAVGPSGRVLAVDRSARFLERLAERAGAQHGAPITTLRTDVEALELPADSVDLAYARWLFCWLVDPDPGLARVAAALRPGAPLLLHEYLDWGTLAVLPRHPALEHAVQACLASWAHDGLHIDLAAQLPERAPRVSLELLELRPVARAGRPGSPVWTWVVGFLRSYLPKLVERGLLAEAARDAALAELDAREGDPRAWLVAPLMAEARLRRAR